MEIGWAIGEITPQVGHEMGGYGFYINRRAEGVLDGLYGRVLLLRHDGRAAMLIQLDLVGLGADHVQELRTLLSQAHGLEASAILLHCTHTHTGPSSFPFIGPGDRSDEMKAFLTGKIVEIAARAANRLHAVRKVAWLERELSGIAFNRESPDGAIDSHLRGLYIEHDGPSPIVLVNYGCHPVTLGAAKQYSADYPGAVARCLAAMGYAAMFLNGPCGDVNPLARRGDGPPMKSTSETLWFYGQRIAEAVQAAVVSATPIEPWSLTWASQMVDLSVAAPPRQQLQDRHAAAEALLAADPANGKARVEFNYTGRCLEMLRLGHPSDRQAVEVQTIGVGDVRIAAVSAEFFAECGLILRKASGIDRLILAATSNGLVGYIPTRESIEKNRYGVVAAAYYGIFPPVAGSGEEFARRAGQFLAQQAGGKQH